MVREWLRERVRLPKALSGASGEVIGQPKACFPLSLHFSRYWQTRQPERSRTQDPQTSGLHVIRVVVVKEA